MTKLEEISLEEIEVENEELLLNLDELESELSGCGFLCGGSGGTGGGGG